MALNDYVRKGEFDRRVKLIEEKLKFFKDDDLQERLDALNQYYIDQLRNTNLNIDVLRQDLENAISEEGAVDANIEALLNSFVTGYNNFAANTLRFNDVFDADGQFTGKIRPLSVETAALSVGTRSQQLALNGIEFRVIPYNSGNGTLEVVASINSKNGSQSGTAGYMFHYGFGTDTDPKIYKINEQSFPINDNSAYYIYVKLPYTHNDVYTEVGNSFNINDYKLHIGELYIRSGSDSNYTYTKVLTYTAGTYYKNAGTNEKPIYSQVEITEDNYFNNVFELYTKNGENYNPVSTPSYDNTKIYCTKSTEDVITYNESVVDNNVATIFINKNQIKLEDISGYLTIKLGYISQPFDSAKIADATTNPKTYYKQRKVDMTYGSTTIDGRLITTGRIEGNDAYFDLDLGEIGGKITFRNTTTGTNDDINDIVNGTTVIAGGMISSNKILLKPLYDIIPNFSTSKAYYYLENNIYKQFPFVYTDGPHVGEIKEEFLIKGYNDIVVYPKNWGSDSKVYEYKNNTYKYIEPISTSASDDIISAGICGEKSLPAFWSGGNETFARNVATVRELYPSKSSHNARKNAYMSDSWSDKIPDVFIDHDGFAKFGDFWVCDGVVSADITVNLSGNKVTGVLPISKGGTNANSQSSAFTNIVAPGGTMTGNLKLKAGQSNREGALDCQNSDIINVNSILTADLANNFGECIGFYRSASTWDCMSANGGTFYFGNNKSYGDAFAGDAAINCGSIKLNSNAIIYNSQNYAILHSNNIDKYTLLNYEGATNSYRTYIDGNGIYFRYGTGHVEAFHIDTSGNIIPNGWTRNLGSSSGGFHTLWIGGATSADMGYNTTTNPRIIFGGNNITQKVQIVYSYYDSYRSPRGLKVMSADAEDSLSTWFEVEGVCYCAGLSSSSYVTALATNSSDKRLKKNIKPFNAIEIVDKLKPVEFEWNKKANKYNSNLELNKKNYGLIAQDSDGIIDDLVFDLPDGKGYKGVRYEKLIPILLQAIKEQQKEINELKKQLHELQ